MNRTRERACAFVFTLIAAALSWLSFDVIVHAAAYSPIVVTWMEWFSGLSLLGAVVFGVIAIANLVNSFLSR